MRRRILQAVGIGFALGACGRQAPDPAAGAAPTARETGGTLPLVRLRAEPYSFDYASGLRDSALVVVRDAGAWATLWSRIHASRGSVPALPVIDFAREMVIVAALGERNSGGYTILVDSALAAPAGGAVFVIRSIAPGPRCGVTAALSQPVDIARTSRRDGPVTFRTHAAVNECP
jgi:hypothetical protein